MDTKITIAVTGEKGGIGKTTTAVSLAVALARNHGKNVLLIEADPQASCCLHLGLRGMAAEAKGKSMPEKGVAQVILGESLDECITPIEKNLDLLAGGPQINVAIVEASTRPRGKKASDMIRKAVDASTYDVAIIDSPPGTTPITTTVWDASDLVILPVGPDDPESILSLQQMKMRLAALEEERGRAPEILGVLATRYDQRRKMAREILAKIREIYEPIGQFIGVVPVDIKVAEAVAAGMPVFDFAPASRGSYYYKLIASYVAAYIDSIRRRAANG